MSKVSLIIQREYLTRVKKRSFVVMTILGPILLASLFIIPIYLAQMQGGDAKKIGIFDDSGLYKPAFQDSESYNFVFMNENLDSAKKALPDSDLYGILYIPKTEVALPETAALYSANQPTLEVKSHLKSLMEKRLEKLKLRAEGIDQETLASINTDIKFSSIKLNKSGEEEKSYAEVATAVGFFGAIVIYFFIFMFGSQVMRGVIEEKTSRIIEVIISSVRPFQLMMGKIIGIAMVGLTQILLWVVLTFGIYMAFTTAFSDTIDFRQQQEMAMQSQQMTNKLGMNNGDNMQNQVNKAEINPRVNKVFDVIQSINFPLIIGSFIFFFLGGYLMYSALFAAIGSAVDNETDTQQFMLPITVPLILSIIVAQFVVQNPEGPLSFWLSIIPLTSPIIMMIRIPFGVPIFDMTLSVILLILGFIATTWLAGKIYRTGILMYGKKVDYKELWKWIRYRS
ncbi:MAG: ABC transporter permease [Bacteroidales bacterium]|nr:ABC transporter permease [Bacteroidales bacterium]MCF8333808.1 ABC transporter permease [Bacteroidales bacterium]